MSNAHSIGNGEMTLPSMDMFMPGIEGVVERVLARKAAN
jgi:hypothetical protein